MAATTLAGELQLQTVAPTHKWLVAIAVMLGTALEVLDNSIINVALPHLQGTFSASVDEIAWVLTSYLVANGIMIPMSGWISSRFGRKRYFLTSVFIFVSASALCGAAQSLDQMVLFRLIQGAAGAAMIPSSQAILMETFPPEQQQLAMAIWGMGLMVAPIAGPTLGGWITDNWNWRWNFYINLPIGSIAFLMVYTFVHDPPFMQERRTRGGKVDYAGIMLLVLSVGLLQIVLDRGQRADWFESPWVVCATGFSALCFILLIARELSFPEPILDLRIFKQRAFVVSVVLTIAMSFVLFGSILLNPLFLQELHGIQRVEDRACAGTARAMFGIIDADDRTVVAPRDEHAAAGGCRVRAGGIGRMADGRDESAGEHDGGSEAQCSDVVRLRDDFPEYLSGRTVVRVARANRLCGEFVQHAAQHRSRNRNRLHDQFAD